MKSFIITLLVFFINFSLYGEVSKLTLNQIQTSLKENLKIVNDDYLGDGSLVETSWIYGDELINHKALFRFEVDEDYYETMETSWDFKKGILFHKLNDDYFKITDVTKLNSYTKPQFRIDLSILKNAEISRIFEDRYYTIVGATTKELLNSWVDLSSNKKTDLKVLVSLLERSFIAKYSDKDKIDFIGLLDKADSFPLETRLLYDVKTNSISSITMITKKGELAVVKSYQYLKTDTKFLDLPDNFVSVTKKKFYKDYADPFEENIEQLQTTE